MWNFVVHTHFSVLQKDPETTSTSLSTRFFCCNFPLLFEASHTIQLTSCASARSTKNLPSRWLWTIVPLAAFLVGEKISRKSYPPGNQDVPPGRWFGKMGGRCHRSLKGSQTRPRFNGSLSLTDCTWMRLEVRSPTVDGRTPAPLNMVSKYHMIYRVLYIPGGAGFLPSTVVTEQDLGLEETRNVIALDIGMQPLERPGQQQT